MFIIFIINDNLKFNLYIYVYVYLFLYLLKDICFFMWFKGFLCLRYNMFICIIIGYFVLIMFIFYMYRYLIVEIEDIVVLKSI